MIQVIAHNRKQTVFQRFRSPLFYLFAATLLVLGPNVVTLGYEDSETLYAYWSKDRIETYQAFFTYIRILNVFFLIGHFSVTVCTLWASLLNRRQKRGFPFFFHTLVQLFWSPGFVNFFSSVSMDAFLSPSNELAFKSTLEIAIAMTAWLAILYLGNIITGRAWFSDLRQKVRLPYVPYRVCLILAAILLIFRSSSAQDRDYIHFYQVMFVASIVLCKNSKENEFVNQLKRFSSPLFRFISASFGVLFLGMVYISNMQEFSDVMPQTNPRYCR